jgi:hypothetical protein
LPPDEIVSRKDRMLSRAWVCATCHKLVTGPTPIPVPAPCSFCGGIAFEKVGTEPQ